MVGMHVAQTWKQTGRTPLPVTRDAEVTESIAVPGITPIGDVAAGEDAAGRHRCSIGGAVDVDCVQVLLRIQLLAVERRVAAAVQPLS